VASSRRRRHLIARVPGVRVGHWTGIATGVTLVLAPPGTVASAEVRGGAPASRELALLDPARTVQHVDAVVLSGGSAFGLAAADGVVRALAERGRGYETRAGPVPIVPALAINDLVAAAGERPGPEEGRAALDAAERDAGHATVAGRVGAGRGATVGGWKGPEYAMPGGLGAAAVGEGDAVVGALAVVNAVGDVVGEDGGVLAGSSAPPDVRGFPEVRPADETEHTTLVVVSTDARLTKLECRMLAESAHDGLARALEPAHTRFDGDTTIALATGAVDGHLDRLRACTTRVVAAAVRSAVAPP
jgi:L-aminopeptidase/D-esterase-like protein